MIYPKVSIIILNWNGLQDTIECLEVFKKNTYPNYEIFVVDNGSNGNDADILKKKYRDCAKIIRCKENLGFTGGNNVGIDFALKQTNPPDYIFLLNNDVKIREDCLTNLVAAALKTGAGIVGAGEKNNSFSGGKLYFGGYPMGKFAVVREFFVQLPMMLSESDAVLETTCVSGASMLIMRDVLLEVHKLTNSYLNDKIFMYYDELDFCNTARELGYKSFSVQNAVIYHKRTSSTGGLYNPVAYYYSVRNSLFLCKNFFLFPLRQIIFIYIFLFNLIRAAKNTIYGRFYSSWAIFCGLHDGCANIGGRWKHHDIVLTARWKAKNSWNFVKLRFYKIPRIAVVVIKRIKNWPVYFLDYFKLVKGKNVVYFFRNGLKITSRVGTTDINIINEVLISDAYRLDKFGIKKGDIVVDIGAHIGTFSLPVSLLAEKVYAFEPALENFRILEKNIKINNIKNIVAFNSAVSDNTGNHELFFNKNDACAHSFYFKSETKNKVKTISLKDILIDNNISKIDYLKLDCEGSEYEILFNCLPEILKKIKKIGAECHYINEDKNPQSLKNFLKEDGFNVKIYGKINVMIYADRIN